MANLLTELTSIRWSDPSNETYGRVRRAYLGEKETRRFTFPLVGVQVKDLEVAERTPVMVGSNFDDKYFWVYKRRLFATSDSRLTPDDVKALVNEVENRRRLQLEKAHALQAMSDQPAPKNRRSPIPQDVKIAVWQRDGGRCVDCDSNKALEFDHIIPLAMGGSNTIRNLQLLCEVCNGRKGATLG